jgi:hypothetical protein
VFEQLSQVQSKVSRHMLQTMLGTKTRPHFLHDSLLNMYHLQGFYFVSQLHWHWTKPNDSFDSLALISCFSSMTVSFLMVPSFCSLLDVESLVTSGSFDVDIFFM